MGVYRIHKKLEDLQVDYPGHTIRKNLIRIISSSSLCNGEDCTKCKDKQELISQTCMDLQSNQVDQIIKEG